MSIHPLRTFAVGALSVAALTTAAVPAAQASQSGRNTLLGAGAGAAAGGLLSHGNVGGIVAGGLVGGVLGHTLSNNHKHYRRGYYGGNGGYHRHGYYRHY